jgi:hypothetical protein
LDILADVADHRSFVEKAAFLALAASLACWFFCCCQNVEDADVLRTNFPCAVILPKERNGEFPNSFEANLAAINRSIASLL